MDHLVEVVGVVESPRVCRVGIFFGRSARTAARAVLLLVTARLLHEVGGFINLGTLQDLGFDGIGGQLDVEAPLFDLFRLGNHLVELANAVDTVIWLLEQTLAHLGHSFLVLSDLLRDADEHAQFWR